MIVKCNSLITYCFSRSNSGATYNYTYLDVVEAHAMAADFL